MENMCGHTYNGTLVAEDELWAWQALIGRDPLIVTYTSYLLETIWIWAACIIIDQKAPTNRYLRLTSVSIAVTTFSQMQRLLLGRLWTYFPPSKYPKLAIQTFDEASIILREIGTAVLLDILHWVSKLVLARLSGYDHDRLLITTTRNLVKVFKAGLDFFEHFRAPLLLCCMAVIHQILWKDFAHLTWQYKHELLYFALETAHILLRHGLWLHMTIKAIKHLRKIWASGKTFKADDMAQKATPRIPLWLTSSPPGNRVWACNVSENAPVRHSPLPVDKSECIEYQMEMNEIDTVQEQAVQTVDEPEDDERTEEWLTLHPSPIIQHNDRDTGAYTEAFEDWILHVGNVWT